MLHELSCDQVNKCWSQNQEFHSFAATELLLNTFTLYAVVCYCTDIYTSVHQSLWPVYIICMSFLQIPYCIEQVFFLPEISEYDIIDLF